MADNGVLIMQRRESEMLKKTSGGLVVILFITGILVLGLLGGVIARSLELGLAIMIMEPFLVTTTYFAISHYVRDQMSHPILEGLGAGLIFDFLLSAALFQSMSGEAQLVAIPIGTVLIAFWSFVGLIIGMIYAALTMVESSSSMDRRNEDEQLPADMRR
jgi:hypothetical protein